VGIGQKWPGQPRPAGDPAARPGPDPVPRRALTALEELMPALEAGPAAQSGGVLRHEDGVVGAGSLLAVLVRLGRR